MDGSPQRWWQWVLMYPTIVVALAGAIPQYYQWITAIALGLSPFENVGDAQQQEKTWERNVSCPRSIGESRFRSRAGHQETRVECRPADSTVGQYVR
jgi:hypothetical protein